jgi:AraC-like DNA-binding protein
MSARPWHTGSVFGAGHRRPLDREQRARFRFLVNAHRRARRLTPHCELIGNALVRRLGTDGQCDPSHETIAADVGCSERTVRRALEAMRGLGLVLWQRRIVRDGWRTSQTSNAYVLVPSTTTNLPAIQPRRCGGQSDRAIPKTDSSSMPVASMAEIAAAPDG